MNIYSLFPLIAITILAMFAIVIVYRLRGPILTLVNNLLEGRGNSQLSEYAERIQNLFSLKEQGSGLLSLAIKATGCHNACLLFPEDGGEDFVAHILEPQEGNPLASLRLEAGSPILLHLAREQQPLSRETMVTSSEITDYLATHQASIGEIELFQPLISRGHLFAILAAGKKESGHYLPDGFSVIRDVAGRVAVAIEKEYLREQLHAREQEVEIINRAATVLTSTLDIQDTFGDFITEVSKLDQIDWAAIVLKQENSLSVIASWPATEPIWQPGERLPLAGSLTELVAKTRQPVFLHDVEQETRGVDLHRLADYGLQSVLGLPLLVRGEVIGTLCLGNRHANAYNQRHIGLFTQLAGQIAASVENARLYARAQEMARVDQLTGLLNRRSFDEMLTNEIGRCSRYGGIFSIIIVDLDSLKVYNDNYGHLAGDKLLRQIGTSIKISVRGVDYAFRQGGDEFSILLPQTPITAANQVAERVRDNVRAISYHQDTLDFEVVPVTASLGVATWPADGVTINEIVAAADEALYQAKRKGGNQVCSASGSQVRFQNMVTALCGNKDERAALGTIYALWAKVDARSHDSHSEKVSEYASALARAINTDPADITRLETCALLHDIGKIVISDEILNKKGELTPREWEIIKTHPRLGANIAAVCQLNKCVPGILHHHERYDGTGYPDRLKGEDIPHDARILAIADAFAAMTSERAYSSCLSKTKALEEIRAGAGRQFDPHLAKVFLALFRGEPKTAGMEAGVSSNQVT